MLNNAIEKTMKCEVIVMNENTNAIVPVNDTNEIFAVVECGQGAIVRETTTTDDVTLFNAVNSTGEKVADNLGVDIIVTNIVITSADVNSDMNDENNDKVNKPCVNFFTADGRQISSISNGIIRATRALFGVGFTPTTERPITIRFKEQKTKKGTCHTFDLVSR